MLALVAPSVINRGREVVGVSARAAAITRAARMRTLYRDLADEFAGVAPPGQVMATAVRSARALQRGGCSADLIVQETERLVRASMGPRARLATSRPT